MKTLKPIKKRFKDTLKAKALKRLYKLTKIEYFDDLWLSECEKYYYGR